MFKKKKLKKKLLRGHCPQSPRVRPALVKPHNPFRAMHTSNFLCLQTFHFEQSYKFMNKHK